MWDGSGGVTASPPKGRSFADRGSAIGSGGGRAHAKGVCCGCPRERPDVWAWWGLAQLPLHADARRCYRHSRRCYELARYVSAGRTSRGVVMPASETRRRAVAAARRLAPALTTAILVGLPWVTIRGTGAGAPFPDALLQAEGAVLAALVFVLGLNQSAVQRGFDALLGEAHDWEGRAAAACVASDQPVAATRVWTWASRDAWVLSSKRGASLLTEARDADEIEKYFDDSWRWERLDWAGRVNYHNEKLANGEVASPRRRRRMEHEVADLERRIERSLIVQVN